MEVVGTCVRPISIRAPSATVNWEMIIWWGIHRSSWTPSAVYRKTDGLLGVAIQGCWWSSHREDIALRFTVGRFLTGYAFISNRLTIHQQEKFSVFVDIIQYLDKINPLDLPKDRHKQMGWDCTREELIDYLSLSDPLNLLGHGVLPQADFAASYLQQSVSSLKVLNLFTANNVLREINALDPVLSFISPSSLHSTVPTYLCFSDASHGSSAYGKTWYISSVFLSAGDEHVYHVLD